MPSGQGGFGEQAPYELEADLVQKLDTLRTSLAAVTSERDEAVRLLQRINRLTRHPHYGEQPMLPLFEQLVGSDNEAFLARIGFPVGVGKQ